MYVASKGWYLNISKNRYLSRISQKRQVLLASRSKPRRLRLPSRFGQIASELLGTREMREIERH